MHHPTESDCTQMLQCHAILFFHIFFQIRITPLQPCADILHRICPDVVHQTILPVVAAGGNRCIVLSYQNCLDSRGTELDTENCLTAAD